MKVTRTAARKTSVAARHGTKKVVDIEEEIAVMITTVSVFRNRATATVASFHPCSLNAIERDTETKAMWS